MRIVKLTKARLAQSIKLIRRCFPNEEADSFDDPKVWLTVSLNKRKYAKFMKETQTHSLNYWIAIEKGKVIGVTGTYELDEDYKDTTWLSWFCVDPKQRGKGLGKILLNVAIDWARKDKKKKFKLYTTTDENEKTAQILYEKMGLKVFKKEKKGTWMYLYRELNLR